MHAGIRPVHAIRGVALHLVLGAMLYAQVGSGPCCFPQTNTCVELPASQCFSQGGFQPIPIGECMGDLDGDNIDELCEELTGCCFVDVGCQDAPPPTCFGQNGVIVAECLGDRDGNMVDDACEDSEPVCQPTPDGSACESTGCDPEFEACLPTAVQRFPDGSFRVLECACGSSIECALSVTPKGAVTCSGGCSPKKTCKRFTSVSADGVATLNCACDPTDNPGFCEPDGSGALACIGVCESQTDVCFPFALRPDGTIGRCACHDEQSLDECLPRIGPGLTPVCGGACPPDQECLQRPRDFEGDDGTDGFSCACDAIGACCGDLFCDEIAAQDCASISGLFLGHGTSCEPGVCASDCQVIKDGLACDGTCPNGTFCVPVRAAIGKSTNDALRITECGCLGAMDCREMMVLPNIEDVGCVQSTCSEVGPACLLGRMDDGLNTEYMCACAACVCGEIDDVPGAPRLGDLRIFQNCFGAGMPAPPDCTPQQFHCCDLNGDGIVTIQDYRILANLVESPSSNQVPNCR